MSKYIKKYTSISEAVGATGIYSPLTVAVYDGNDHKLLKFCHGVVDVPLKITGTTLDDLQIVQSGITGTLYNVTNTLSHVTNSNTKTTALYASPYNATLTPDASYNINSVVVKMNSTDITSTVYSEGNIAISFVDGPIEINATAIGDLYTITNTLTRVTNSNSASSINHGDPYNATLTADTGYTINSVVIKMGGTDVTSTVYNAGNITIAQVTGPIEISATAATSVYSITNTLTNATSSNPATTINHGESYSASITPNTGYNINTVTIKMGDDDITSTAYSNRQITIAQVTGPLSITITAGLNVYGIVNSLTHTTNSNAATTINHGDSYVATLTPETGYAISSVKVEMNGADVTSSVYSEGTIAIPGATGNIVITASSAKAYTVTNTLTKITNSNPATSAKEGEAYNATLIADTGYTVLSVTVVMNGVDVTNSVYSAGTIAITSVNGDIVITASAAPNTYSITNTLTNVTNSNPAIRIDHDMAYDATLTATLGYAISSVSVVMNGVDVTSSVYSNGTIAITSVDGDIVITASASVAAIITSSLRAATSSNTAISTALNAPYTTTITPVTDAIMQRVRVYMGGTNITSTAYNESTGVVNIANVTGNIDIQAVAYLFDYLCFTARTDNTVIYLSNVTLSGHTNQPDVQYSTDGGTNWTNWDYSNITLANTGDKVWFKGTNPNGFSNIDEYYHDMLWLTSVFVTSSGAVTISGNIMSLIDGQANGTRVIPSNSWGCFTELFRNCNVQSIENLLLPATTLGVHCYHQMFYGIGLMTEAPDLPAETMVEGCYYRLFYGCYGLQEIYCQAHENMSVNQCTSEWVREIDTVGGVFYKHPDATWETGEHGVPENWTIKNN